MLSPNNLLLLLWLLSAPALAQQLLPDMNSDQSSYEDIEINGLVVDETITKVGRDFYELFFQQWTSPNTTTNYTLFIQEKPMNGLGSQIAIFINETEIFNQAVQPRFDVIEALAQYAVSVSYQYLQNYESIVQQLGSDDQAGSGIF